MQHITRMICLSLIKAHHTAGDIWWTVMKDCFVRPMAEHPWRKLSYLAWNKSNGRLLYEDCSKTRDRKVDLKSAIFSLEQCICKLLAKYRRLRRICRKRLFHLLLCLMADLTSIFRPYLTQLRTPKIYPSGIMMDPVLDRLLERTVKSSFTLRLSSGIHSAGGTTSWWFVIHIPQLENLFLLTREQMLLKYLAIQMLLPRNHGTGLNKNTLFCKRMWIGRLDGP